MQLLFRQFYNLQSIQITIYLVIRVFSLVDGTRLAIA